MNLSALRFVVALLAVLFVLRRFGPGGLIIALTALYLFLGPNRFRKFIVSLLPFSKSKPEPFYGADSYSSPGTGQASYSDLEGTFRRALQEKFLRSAFGMLGKFTKADGRVSSAEIQLIENLMREKLNLNAEARKQAIEIFRAAKNSHVPFRAYAAEYYSTFSDQRQAVLGMFEFLFRLATIDGTLSLQEEQLLREATQVFRVSETEFSAMYSRYVGAKRAKSTAKKYYEILQCSEKDSLEDIKKKYRELAQEFHPDKIAGKGLNQEFVQFANDKFKQIQQAYQAILEERGKSR